MIRIQLSPDPQWLDLGHGVRLKLLPLTTALMVATRSDPAVQDLEPGASNDERAAIFATALARRAVVDWEGVGDVDGKPIPVTDEGIDALLSLWPIFEAFNLRYVSHGMLLDEEKIVYSKAIIYKTVASDLSDLAEVNYDVLVFFSPSGIKSLTKNFPKFKQNNTRIAAFGPTTAQAVLDAGLRLDIQAPIPAAPSMTMALEQYIRKANKG